MSDVLEKIVSKTRERIEIQKKKVPLFGLEKQIGFLPSTRSFPQALNRGLQWAVIAELKQASPSAGLIRLESHIQDRIKGYEEGGAAALSILTEEHYFKGSPHLLEMARQLTNLPILRKDFIVDTYQVVESRILGADAILLIATLLPGSHLKDFLDLSLAIGLHALVEVHSEEDLDHALDSGATVLGINNRDLRTLQVDLGNAKRLLPLVPKEGKTMVVESGIRSPDDLTVYRGLGAHAVLIGETLMREENPCKAVQRYSTLPI